MHRCDAYEHSRFFFSSFLFSLLAKMPKLEKE